MVKVLDSNLKEKTVEITMNMNEIFDTINGLNILVGQKEEEMNKHGVDSLDTQQYNRFKKLLKDMQEVKAIFR